MNILHIKNLKTYFFLEEGILKAVNGISFSINQGEIMGLVGESGCGKSVTALSVLKLIPDPPGKIVDGSIYFKGYDLALINEKDMRKIRGKDISIIFQDPMTALNPVKTVGDQIAEVFRIHFNERKNIALDHALQMMRSVEISRAADRLRQYPHQMSGGMLQRIMIAIALSCKPSVLIADEATSALDVTIQFQIIKLMKKLQKMYGSSLLVITHDFGVVVELCDRVAVMYAGKIVEEASTEELFNNPLHPYTKGLLYSIPKLGVKKTQLNTIRGVVPRLINLPSGCIFSNRCNNTMEICNKLIPRYLEHHSGHFVACHLYKKKE
jgi:oligopeptide/dipeptide ABC transporter ATP-binding protein